MGVWGGSQAHRRGWDTAPPAPGEARDGSQQGCGKDLPGTAKGSYGEKMEAAALLAGGETVRPRESSAPPQLHHAKWTPPPPPAPVPVFPTPGPLSPAVEAGPRTHPAPRLEQPRRAEVRRGEVR